MINAIGVPNVTPSITPLSHSTSSSSRKARGETPAFRLIASSPLASNLPARLSSASRIISMSIRTPAGTPSSTPPIALPCDSPKEVKTKFFPNLFIAYSPNWLQNYKKNCIYKKKAVTLHDKTCTNQLKS